MFRKIQNYKPYIWAQKLPKRPSGASRPKTVSFRIWYLLYIPAGKYKTVDVPQSTSFNMLYDDKVREFVITMRNSDSTAPEHYIEGYFEIDVANGMSLPMVESRVKVTVESDGGPGEGGSSVGNYEDSDDD